MPEFKRIYTYPDPVLRKKAQPVNNIDGDTQVLIDNMAETMYAAPGIGLAAVQIGQPLSLIVYDVSQREKGRDLSVIINPEIVLRDGNILYEEACLSVLDFSAEVTRSEKVKVRGVDRHGNPLDIEAEGLQGREECESQC